MAPKHSSLLAGEWITLLEKAFQSPDLNLTEGYIVMCKRQIHVRKPIHKWKCYSSTEEISQIYIQKSSRLFFLDA